MASLSPGTLALLVLAPLIAWRVWARFRRLTGKQRLSKYRPPITITIFTLLVVLVALPSTAHPERLLPLIAGLTLGAALGTWGLGKTTFEPTPQGLFYTPNAHLGIALSLLFVARMAWRLVEIYVLSPTVPRNATEFAQSGLTLFVFGILAAYFIRYAIGLARWRAGVLRRKREREEKAREAATAEDSPPPPGNEA